jgi:hypothetical protein
MSPEPSLTELKKLVKNFYSSIPKKSSPKAQLHKFADEMGLTQIESKVAEVSNKEVKKNRKDLLKPVVNLLPDNTHQAPSLPKKPKSVSEPEKTKVSKPEQLHNYRNLHAKTHQTVIVPGLSLQHLEDSQHRYAEVEHELHQERERTFKPVVLDKHLSQAVKDLRIAVDTKNTRHSGVQTEHEEKPMKVSKATQSKPEMKSMGHQSDEPTVAKMEAGRKAYFDFINPIKAGGKSHKEAIAMWKAHQKNAKALKK